VIYTVTIFDENGERATVLSDVSDPSYSRSKNTADQVDFAIPRNDPKIQEIKTGRKFEIVRTLNGETTTEASGYISNHSYSEQTYDIEGYTEEIILGRYFTPPQFGYNLQSQFQNIKVLAEELDRPYLIERVKFNWDDYVVDSSGVTYQDSLGNVRPFVLLQNSGTPQNPQYATGGGQYIVFEFEKNDDERWDRFRWVSDYYKDEQGEVTTKVSYASSDDPNNFPAFSQPQAGAETDVVGIVIATEPPADDKYVRVKVDFNTTSNKTSPVFFVLEAIRRGPPILDDVVVDNSATGIITPGLTADNTSFFDVLTATLEPSGYEFKVENNVLYVANTFGSDRTNDFSVVGS